MAGIFGILLGGITFAVIRSLAETLPPPLFNDPEEAMKAWWAERGFERDGVTPLGYNSEISVDEEMVIDIPEHRALPHILLHGGAGQGKTALAQVATNELAAAYEHEVEFIKVVPSQLNRKKDLDEVMMKVAKHPYCVLFIDEVHGLERKVEESLYSALQDFEYDITLSKDIDIGDGVNIKISEDRGFATVALPKFTCIGATTLLGQINKPLKDRFPIRIEMADYNEEDLVDIVDVFTEHGKPTSFDTYIGQDKAKKILGMHIKSVLHEGDILIAEEAKHLLAQISMQTSRLVIQRTKNVLALARSRKLNVVTPDIVENMMEMYGIDKDGLDRVHRAIIEVLIKRKNKPIGSNALAEAVGVTKDDIDSIYIGELTKVGLVTRDSRSMKLLTEEALQKYGEIKN